MSDLIDTSKQDKLEAKAKRKREKELGDIRKLRSMPEGRRFLWRVLSKAGVFRTSWTGEANQTLVNEGRRTLGLEILNDLMEADPTAFMQMQREFNAEYKQNQLIEEEIENGRTN